MAQLGAALEKRLSDHPDLRRTFDRVAAQAARDFPGETLEAWYGSCGRLVESGLGNAGLLTYLRSGPACAHMLGAESAIRLGRAAATVSQAAGDQAARALLAVAPKAARVLGAGASFWSWLRVVEELGALAPESIDPLMNRVEGLLGQLDVRAFEAWALGGVRSAGGDSEARLRFFSFADPRAEQWLQRESGEVELSQVERRLKSYLMALWHLRCPIRRPAKTDDGVAPRRAGFDGQIIRMPESFRGFAGQRAADLFRAAVAHISAHLMFSKDKFPVGELKPIQIALVSIVEDARVEQLAMDAFPGLRRLWLPFHVAQPSGALTAPGLMARLSRALIDPDYQDDNAWVEKGRRLFLEQRDNWQDPSISRTIGGLLGNDIGQMRVQFNARTYVVEPPYRDDNMGLWDFGEIPPEQAPEVETVYESVRIEHKPEDASPSDTAVKVEVLPEDEGMPIAQYPEWDYVIGRDRPDWTTLVDFPVRAGSLNTVNKVLEEHPVLVNRITALIKSAKISRPVRLRRQPEGDRLDLDACIEAAVSRRRRETPDPRVYMTVARRHRDLAVLVLLDVSESTNDRIKGGYRRVLSLERDAAILLAHAMDELGDPFAIRAFCSNGREEVRYLRIKDFAEAYLDAPKRRLAGLAGGLSTRIGAALRHAGGELSRQLNHRKLLLVITDGEPSDIDVADRKYLVEDARRAVALLGHWGVDVFCVGLDSGGDSYLHRIFGRTNVLLIDRIERLPEQLTALYFRLTK